MSLLYLLKYYNILVVLYFFLYWTCHRVFFCLRFDEMRLSVSYEFYMKDILRTYRIFVKSFKSALLFICVYAMNDTEGIVQEL